MADDKMKLDAEFRNGNKWNKKWLVMGAIIGVIVCIIAAAISIGLWIGMKEIILNEKKVLSKNLEQETEVYSDSKVVVMTTKLNDYETVFIQDYNTYLEVMKTLIQDREVCFISTINYTSTFKPAGFSLANKNIDQRNFTDSYYEVSGGRVTDISFLNKQARYLCKGVDAYWVVQKRMAKDETGLRLKRSYGGGCGGGCGCGCGGGGFGGGGGGYGGGGCGCGCCCTSHTECCCRSVCGCGGGGGGW